MKRVFDNLYGLIFEAAGLETDRRFKAWVKQVTAVNPDHSDGFAFGGPFLKEGTVEIELKPSLFLVAAQTGSHKYRTTQYRVVQMDATGTLTRTVIKTDDSTPGWALRIRDRIAALLAEQPPAEQPPQDIRFAIDEKDEETLILINPNTNARTLLPTAMFRTLVMLEKAEFDAFLSLCITVREAPDDSDRLIEWPPVTPQ